MSQPITIRTAALAGASAPLTVIYVAENQAPSGAAASIWAATGLVWAESAEAGAFKGKQGQALDVLASGGKRLLVLGRGQADADIPLNGWTDRGGSLLAKIAATRAETVAVVIDEAGATPSAIGELAAGLRLRHYRFDKYKSVKSDDAPVPLAVTLHVADPTAANAAIAIAAPQSMARCSPAISSTNRPMSSARSNSPPAPPRWPISVSISKCSNPKPSPSSA